MSWTPTRILMHIGSIDSSTGVSEVMTDAGRGYLKALGNAEGPHALAREYIGTTLAGWLGLPVFEMAIVRLGPNDLVPLGNAKRAESGPAIITRAEAGNTWGGDAGTVGRTCNSQDTAGIVLLDTWLLHLDRYAPPALQRRENFDNVFISSERSGSAGTLTLMPIDHSHVIDGVRGLTRDAARIDRVKDPHIYGMFPGFRPHVLELSAAEFVARMAALEPSAIQNLVEGLPSEWEVDASAVDATVAFLNDRRSYLGDSFLGSLESALA